MDGPLSIRHQELTVVSETCCGPQQRNLAATLYADLASIKAQALAKELSERFTAVILRAAKAAIPLGGAHRPDKDNKPWWSPEIT